MSKTISAEPLDSSTQKGASLSARQRQRIKIYKLLRPIFSALAALLLLAHNTSGEPKATSAPALLLANVWTPAVDPSGWWMSEKYDGVRGFWDGKKLSTRN